MVPDKTNQGVEIREKQIMILNSNGKTAPERAILEALGREILVPDAGRDRPSQEDRV